MQVAHHAAGRTEYRQAGFRVEAKRPAKNGEMALAMTVGVPHQNLERNGKLLAVTFLARSFMKQGASQHGVKRAW